MRASMRMINADTHIYLVMARQERDAADITKDNGIQLLQLVEHIAFTAANGPTESVDSSKKQLDDHVIKLFHLIPNFEGGS